jgi:RHS repeat-associated protein
MGQRWYDPATGRFLSRDPIGFQGGFNLYGYVGGNPIKSSSARREKRKPATSSAAALKL